MVSLALASQPPAEAGTSPGQHCPPVAMAPWLSRLPWEPLPSSQLAGCASRRSSSPEPTVCPGKQGEESYHHLPEGPWTLLWVKPQQRMRLFLQCPGKGQAWYSRHLVTGQLLTERGQQATGPQREQGPFLPKAWVMFLCSASPKPCAGCILKIDANICPSPFVSCLFISFVHFLNFLFFLLLICRSS